jgi:hypothetical protein
LVACAEGRFAGSEAVAASAQVIERFGDFNYRRFRSYLWGAAYEFLSRSLDCYRMIIEYPQPKLLSPVPTLPRIPT